MMIHHLVFLWAKDPSDTNLILNEAQKLAPIPSMKNFHVGQPIPSERPVVDSSYTVVLSMTFENQTAADEYQVHPLHKSFTENVVRKLIEKVLIYDFQ